MATNVVVWLGGMKQEEKSFKKSSLLFRIHERIRISEISLIIVSWVISGIFIYLLRAPILLEIGLKDTSVSSILYIASANITIFVTYEMFLKYTLYNNRLKDYFYGSVKKFV